jgi:uncharacterized protein
MEQKYNNERKKVVKYLIIILAILAALNLVFIFLNDKKDTGTVKENIDNIFSKNTDIKFLSNINGTLVSLNVPAVDTDGKGIATTLSVESTKGSGKTLVDIENLLFWADTQQSIRMARFVAGNITGKNLNNYDLIYSIKVSNTSLIGGPSAGSAIAIATIFALNGEKPRGDVMITGTINHDGTIGPVSGILEKAKAAKQANAKIFLVPLSQSSDVEYNTKEHCQPFGTTEVCSTETTPRKINVSEEAGIKIIEVENINEALTYFI